jgi:hypothetical protein
MPSTAFKYPPVPKHPCFETIDGKDYYVSRSFYIDEGVEHLTRVPLADLPTVIPQWQRAACGAAIGAWWNLSDIRNFDSADALTDALFETQLSYKNKEDWERALSELTLRVEATEGGSDE